MLGQLQRSVVEGDFYGSDFSFKGKLTNVNVWDHVLDARVIEQMSTSCLSDEPTDRKVYNWIDFLNAGEARLIEKSSCKPIGIGM